MTTTKSKLTRVLTLVLVLATVFSCAAYSVLGAESLMSGSAGKGYASASPASESPVAIELLPGAEVRLDEEQSGLRFTTRIPTADLAAIAGEYTVGTLIYPTDKLNGALTVETEGALNLTDATPIVDGEYTYFHAAIVDILPANYARKFSAVSYIKIGDDYFYTAYSEADNSRSIFEVAVAAWEGNYKDNAIIKAYLDKVVVINGSMQLSKTIKGYTSPYNVSYANNTITVTATDGTLVDGDIATMIVDYNGRVFTGGWTIADNTLTAKYDAKLNLIETFDGLSVSESAGSIEGDSYSVWWRSFYGNSPNTKKKISNGVLQLMKYDAETAWPKLHLKGNVAEALGDINDTLTVSFSVKAPEGRGVPRMTLKLCKDNSDTNAISLNLAIRDSWFYYGGTGSAPTDAGKIVAITNTDWVDITLRFDFVTSTMSVYVNGEYHSSTTVSGMNLTYAKTYMTSYALRMDWASMTYTSIQGICFDSFSWGVSKTH